MSTLGAVASALQKSGSAVGKTLLKKTPFVGPAVSLLWPKAAAKDEDVDMNDPRIKNWANSQKKAVESSKSVDSSKYMTPVSEFPKDINDSSSGGGSGSGSSNKKITDAIGRGWDDAGDVVDATKKSLNTSEKYISNLGKVANQYRTSLDTYKNKNEAAIAGNKTLIEKNQKGALDDLAGDTRKSMENTNVMLGIKGASGGSASKLASKAIARSAGKERSNILTGWGDEFSKQNQAGKHIVEEYNVKRAQSYNWEKEEKERAMEEFKASQAALKRLDGKKSKWKQEDIDAESDRNFNNFISSLSSIQAKAQEFRTTLSNKMIEYGGLADELESASVDIDSPAELDTPEFSENIDFENTENAEDFYDPKNTGKKRVIKRYDPLTGEPIYEDEEEEALV